MDLLKKKGYYYHFFSIADVILPMQWLKMSPQYIWLAANDGRWRIFEMSANIYVFYFPHECIVLNFITHKFRRILNESSRFLWANRISLEKQRIFQHRLSLHSQLEIIGLKLVRTVSRTKCMDGFNRMHEHTLARPPLICKRLWKDKNEDNSIFN